MITVSVCCNNPDNGCFDGTVSAIEIHGCDGCDITLEPRTYPAPKFSWLADPPKLHDARETSGFKVARFKFRCAPFRSWYGNWCWDAVKMSGVEVLRLCRVLCAAGWSCTEADCEFAEAWDRDHTELSKELLSKALRPESDPRSTGAERESRAASEEAGRREEA